MVLVLVTEAMEEGDEEETWYPFAAWNLIAWLQKHVRSCLRRNLAYRRKKTENRMNIGSELNRYYR